MYRQVLFLHMVAATVWTGGHLVLALTILPRALRQRSTAELMRFESGYEKVGMPALVIQVLSGFWLAQRQLPPALWFGGDSAIAQLILSKLGLLGATALLAAHARLRVIPGLTPERLPLLAAHVILVTVISIAFVLVGSGFRFGGF